METSVDTSLVKFSSCFLFLSAVRVHLQSHDVQPYFSGTLFALLFVCMQDNCPFTVEPPITDPPTSGQPLYNGHWLWHQMKLLQN